MTKIGVPQRKKKMRKIPMIFDIEIDFKSQIFRTFWHFPIKPNSQNSKISYWYVDSWAKTFLETDHQNLQLG